jgi:Dyp-type peroxidase family
MAPVTEPVLAADDIQGDSLAGFRKDYVRLVFFQLRADNVPAFKVWLSGFAKQVSTLEQVAGFNMVFKAMRAQGGEDPTGISALWRNIGFTAPGLEKLIGAAELQQFADPSFRAGAEAVSETLGDGADGAPGNPSTWLIGSGQNVPDGMIILAADSLQQLEDELGVVTAALAPFVAKPPYVEAGETRAQQRGHEHFGFKDGISQPAPRGKMPAGHYLVPRYLDPADPQANYFAAPGQALVWPGEFLLNGLKQKGANADPIETRSIIDAPGWATNGSYLVFRRLRQDVRRFNEMLDQTLAALEADGAFSDITRDHAGALLVGRFASGCPVMRADHDDLTLAADPYASNNFNFSTASHAFQLVAGAPVPADMPAAAPADRDGVRCPFGAHLRKVNPRDDSTDIGSGFNNLQRRILRRGIPYGPDYDPLKPDDLDRGLLFMCYQASIENQFQQLVTDWVNSDDGPKKPSGYDPLISTGPDRQFLVRRPDKTTLTIPLTAELVVATGAAFLFMPPVSALRGRLAKQ